MNSLVDPLHVRQLLYDHAAATTGSIALITSTKAPNVSNFPKKLTKSALMDLDKNRLRVLHALRAYELLPPALQSILQRCLALTRSNMPILTTVYKIMPGNSLPLGWVKREQHLDRHTQNRCRSSNREPFCHDFVFGVVAAMAGRVVAQYGYAHQ